MKIFLRVLAAVALAAGIAAAAVRYAAPAEPKIEKDIVYRKVDDVELNLDVIRPAGDGPFPTLLFIHGGAWHIGDRKDFHATMLTYARLGYAGATVQYRLAPRYKYPAPLDDVRAALAFLRREAKTYKIDPERIAVVGSSAGGHLALMLGLAKEDGKASGVRAVVNMVGLTDFRTYQIGADGDELLRKAIGKDSKGMLKDFLGTADPRAKIMAEASPVTHVARDSPPVLTLHGTADNLVPVAQARLLHEALKKAGATEQLVIVEDGGHLWEFWPAKDRERAQRGMAEFLDKHMKR